MSCWVINLSVVSELNDFSRSLAATYNKEVILPQTWCVIETWLLHITLQEAFMFHLTADSSLFRTILQYLNLKLLFGNNACHIYNSEIHIEH